MKKLADNAIQRFNEKMSTLIDSRCATDMDIDMAAMVCRIQELESPEHGHKVDKELLHQKTETELKYLIELVQEVLNEKSI